MSLDGESCDGDWRRSQVPIYFAFIIRGSRNLCYHHKNAFTKWDVNGIGVQKFQLDLRSWAGIGNRWLSEMALELMAQERYSELGHVARKEGKKRLNLASDTDWTELWPQLISNSLRQKTLRFMWPHISRSTQKGSLGFSAWTETYLVAVQIRWLMMTELLVLERGAPGSDDRDKIQIQSKYVNPNMSHAVLPWAGCRRHQGTPARRCPQEASTPSLPGCVESTA